MTSERTFALVDASHAVSADGVHVVFVDGQQVEYRRGERAVRLDAEPFIAEDGAPDGRIIRVDDARAWNDGAAVTPTEFRAILEDLRRAGVALQSKFHLA